MKTHWSFAPFRAYYKNFDAKACVWSKNEDFIKPKGGLLSNPLDFSPFALLQLFFQLGIGVSAPSPTMRLLSSCSKINTRALDMLILKYKEAV